LVFSHRSLLAAPTTPRARTSSIAQPPPAFALATVIDRVLPSGQNWIFRRRPEEPG
jgi:hypothetical protein